MSSSDPALNENIYPIKVKYPAKNTFTKHRRPYKKYDLSEWDWKTVLDETLILKQTEKNYLEIISHKYGIVKKTLMNNLSKYVNYGTYPHNVKGQSNKFFSEDDEKALSDDIKINYVDKNKPFDGEYLKILALKKSEEQQTNNVFAASDGWCTDFKKKWGLSSVTPNKKRKLKNDNEEEISLFKKDCKENYERVGPKFFYNMDETHWPLINMVNTTFGHTGAESTQIHYNGNDKNGFTTAFCVSAAGVLLDIIVVKKGKTQRCLNSLICPDTFVKCYSNNGWMNSGIMVVILDLICKNAEKKPSVLVLDKHGSHDNDFVKEEAKKRNIKLIYIPSNLTFKYQPLDVGINGPLKSCARRLWKKEQLDNQNKVPKMNNGIIHLSTAIKQIIDANIIQKAFHKALSFMFEPEKMIAPIQI